MTNREVMQHALECIERLNMRGWILADFEDEVYAAISALKAALEQPEQEPVAYYHPHKGFYWAKPTHISAPTVVDVPPVPLYVKWIAPKGPWQGLTDEEKKTLATAAGCTEDDDGHIVTEILRLAEAALKERNT